MDEIIQFTSHLWRAKKAYWLEENPYLFLAHTHMKEEIVYSWGWEQKEVHGNKVKLMGTWLEQKEIDELLME
jgi:hypothetical protein